MRLERALIFSVALFCSGIGQAAQAEEPTGTVQVEANSLQSLLEALILERGIEIIKGNIDAAKNESGDIDKAVRAVLGISIKDINEHGLLGGPNSEMRKLFKALGIR